MVEEDIFKDVIKDVLPKACQVYNKTLEDLQQDIEVIRKWLEQQPHLPEIMDDAHIRYFLFTNKFRIERTKPKIDMYYTIRSLLPQLYDDCNPKSPRMQKVFEIADICLHPKLFQDLYRVYIYRYKEPNTFSPRDVLLTSCNITEIRFHEDIVIDDIHIVDFETLSFNDVSKLASPTSIMEMVMICEKVYTIRIKGIYFINAPPYVAKVAAILKNFLKPKVFERVHICENAEILKTIFTIDTLPKDYGGRGPSLRELTDIMKKKLEQYQDRFDKLDQMRVDESLRPQKLIDDDILGYHGTFKKLSID